MDSTGALQSCVLFKGMGEGTLQQLAGIARLRSFDPGVALFSEASAADAMFVIAAGTVKLSARDGGNTDIQLGEVGAGESVGELSVLQGGKRLCTATAITAVEVLEIRQADFNQLAALKPQPCLKLAISIGGELGRRMEAGRGAWRGLLHREATKR